MLATYIHDLDPIIVSFGDLKLRWYGLAYLLGFIGGYYLLRWLAGKKLWVLEKDQIGDFITYAAFFGVFLGGRLGHMLFYETVNEGPSWMWEDPLRLFRVWEGGMASHGGILGLTIFAWFYARRYKVSWIGIGDGLVIASTIGLFTGRMANFINGEIYGKIAHGIPWAVKFPRTLVEVEPELSNQSDAIQAAAVADPTLVNPETNTIAPFETIIEHSRENDALLTTLGEHIEPRHPAQVYEALSEGLLLFTILLVVRLFFPKLPHGFITGLFFILYAGARIFCESYKLSETKDIFGLSMGTFLSIFMVLAGIGFIIYSLKSTNRLDSKIT